jgi:hypothetical protein
MRREFSKEESAVMNALIYFGIFNYPLSVQEVLSFTQNVLLGKNETENILNHFIKEGLVTKIGEYYAVNNSEELITRRIAGNTKAMDYFTKAKKYAQLIYRFPFVRGVYVSGSLSKGFVDSKGDIDYFIITQPGRLWLARTLLILYKKIFLINSHKYICVNYFIDTDHLEIPDKNIFTATELLTLLPMHGHDVFSRFIDANKWAQEFLPNHRIADHEEEKSGRYGITLLIENALNNRAGDWLDELFMKLTIKRWKTKFVTFSSEDFENAMRSRKYVSKHHPQNFQRKVLQKLNELTTTFEGKFNVKIND